MCFSKFSQVPTYETMRHDIGAGFSIQFFTHLKHTHNTGTIVIHPTKKKHMLFLLVYGFRLWRVGLFEEILIL